MWMVLLCVCFVRMLPESLAFLNVQYNSAMNQYLNDINKFKTGQYSISSGQATNNGFSYATNEYGNNAFPTNTMEVTDINIYYNNFQFSYIHSSIAVPQHTPHPKQPIKYSKKKNNFKLNKRASPNLNHCQCHYLCIMSRQEKRWLNFFYFFCLSITIIMQEIHYCSRPHIKLNQHH